VKFLHDVWYTFLRHLRNDLREPVWMFFGMIQPLIWLLLFTQLFQNVAAVPGFPTSSYIEFFAPGLIVMLAVFGPAYAGFEVLSDIYHGVLEKTLVTPVNRYALITGSAINWALGLALRVLIVFSIAYAMGVEVVTGFGGVLLTILIVTLLGLGFFGLSNALILVTKSETPLVVTANLATMPLMFLSSVMAPSEFTPEWIRIAMKLNPVNYAVEAVRPLFLSGFDWTKILVSLTVLGIFSTLGITTATLALRKFGE